MTPSGPPAARRPVLAIDVGGTKIAAAAVTADGRVVRRTTVPTPADRSADVVADAVLRAVDDVDDRGREEFGDTEGAHAPAFEAVGIGSAGPLDSASGTVSR